jgi:DNA invertase Pin-like site-specific DNA recombinase
MSKQKNPSIETIEINGKLATTVSGAIKLLNQRAKEEFGIERNYSRDAVYAMFAAGKIEGIRTPSANYYFLDTLNTVRLDPYRRKKPVRQTPKVGKEGYPQAVKEEALKLYGEGILSKRAIARRLEISYQTVNNWIKTDNAKMSDTSDQAA